MVLAGCSGSGKPDPIHSLGKKRILNRSSKFLPDWVTAPRDVWIKTDVVELKVYYSGDTILSNALYKSSQKLPELTRKVVRNYIRNCWSASPPAERVTNSRLLTALYLNRIFTSKMELSISNLIKQKEQYWELWQKKTSDETKRAFTVYHLLSSGKTGLNRIIIKRSTAITMSNGAGTLQTNLQNWLRAGPFTTPLSVMIPVGISRPM